MTASGDLLDAISLEYTGWFIVFAMLTVIEFIFPTSPQSLRGRLFGLIYWIVSIPFGVVMVMGWNVLWHALGLKPLLTIPLFAALGGTGLAGALFGIVIAAMLQDFFFYWYHRAQHRWLWRFHAVHHSIEDLNAVNSYHHIGESLMSLVLLTLPASLIVTDPRPAIAAVGFVRWLHVVYLHSPTRLHFGSLRAIFADNRFHRIHHSLEERHFDRNFGAFTTLWDRIFGTAHFPARGEWPAVGLAQVHEPASIGEWLDLPSRYGKAAAAADAPRPVEGTVPG